MTPLRGLARCPEVAQGFARWAAAVTLAGVAAVGPLLCGPAQAQEYSRFLGCKGSLTADNKTHDAFADFALRLTGRRALIQASNMLPVGEILDYVPTPANYSMTYRLRPVGTQVLTMPGWFQTSALVFFPNLKRLNQIRLSVNRQTGQLNGSLFNEEQEALGVFTMQCSSQSEEEIGKPKF